MEQKYSYPWYISQFQQAKKDAESLILSVNETQFLQPPSEGKWCIAECFSHLINYGNLYYDNLATGIKNPATTEQIQRPFAPRWLVRKLVHWFEPPYKIKLKTVSAMKPGPVSGFDRMQLVDEYLSLQDRFIALLEEGRHNHADLEQTKMNHPLISILKMSLTETFALAEAHQRRHQWQAQQTLQIIEV
ncbi:DinB family protein [Fodinibius halophilus]|uniref:DinB family protein n=1 Tax=Fodinibius halophilus TaxID=1736908 RepID=A0A6M1T2X0_9BACT|nr:DinB family protein [Fodinibius halophilus]NGP88389.1 DinB family protein [Fodinibius halophilus]